MVCYTIGKNEAGQRLDKYLKKLLKEAPASFIYKMLRKKNIIKNGRKCDGSEKLMEGDEVKLFLSDETLEKFSGRTSGSGTAGCSGSQGMAHSIREEISADGLSEQYPYHPLDVIYEDEDWLVVNKPAGALSQKAAVGDISMNEWVIGYLLHEGSITAEELTTFKPSVCNRLDRNTSGLLAAGKTLAGSQSLSEAFRERTVQKFYRCLAAGAVKAPIHLKGYLVKDTRTNQVRICREPEAEARPIETEILPLAEYGDVTLLSVHLITGRTHQIRAHLASIGHPILGDPKYGDSRVNEKWRKLAGVRRQLLHAYCLRLADGREFTAELPKDFVRVLERLQQ